MTVPSGHRDRLVTGRLLDFLDGRTRHRKPGTERVPVAVPDVARYLRGRQTGLEPGPGVEASLRADMRKYPRIAWLSGTPETGDRSQRSRVEPHDPGTTIFGLCQVYDLPAEINLRP